jgi:hypothetical protein
MITQQGMQIEDCRLKIENLKALKIEVMRQVRKILILQSAIYNLQ